jgi:hypothetical protein
MNCLHSHFIGDNITTALPVSKRRSKMISDSVQLVSVQATVHKEHNCAMFQDFLTDILG